MGLSSSVPSLFFASMVCQSLEVIDTVEEPEDSEEPEEAEILNETQPDAKRIKGEDGIV